MAPANATSPDLKLKKPTDRVSKPDLESPVSETGASEPAFLKELQKNLRNATKKLNATAKVDTILKENEGKSLDELVAEKKINTDQKAQVLKKPALESQIAQIQQQIGQYREIANQYEQQLAKQKAAAEEAHQKELESVRANAIADATATTAKTLRQQLLSVSKFLCAAANSRRDGDAESLEARAFEGVLFQVYAGNQEAVSNMIKLIDGADERVVGVEGEVLEMSYGDVKQASNKFAPVEPAELTTDTAPASDPTLANAGLNELQDTSVGAEAAAAQASTDETPDQVAPPSQTLTAGAANSVAETTYDPTSMTSSTTTDGWVNIPRDPAETDTGLQATPANIKNTAEASGAKAQTGGQNRNRNRNRNHNGRERAQGESNSGGREGNRGSRGRGRGGRGRGRGGANASAPASGEQ
ncbi:hypothetical protein N7532_009043 [Penicillium argentinense]|uniref:YAG7-like dimerisation domain-containing protein n=1 Tax=Penicillium argentinense TaxID=1131581 RepID=A0A9W9K259_9EURO|nr:uncharacterized protein N7532_009043 [Penicillium argentinense]KAJ5090359.1 hypothetical protein N7532_009043 [Penicillium argentinense]